MKRKIKDRCFQKNGSPNNYITTQSDWFERKGLVDVKDYILKATPFVTSGKWTERIYCLMNDIIAVPVCSNDSCVNKVQFENYTRGYRRFCSMKCGANSTEKKKKIQKTMEERWGGHISRNLMVKDKKKNTMIKNHGVPYNLLIPEIREKTRSAVAIEKSKNTVLDRYGVKNAGWTAKAIESRIKNGSMVDPLLQNEFKLYRRRVCYFTHKQDLRSLSNYHLRGNIGFKEGAYHIDHKVSIKTGFENNIPPFIMGDIVNLEMIPGKSNISKGVGNSITISELIERYYEKFRSKSTGNGT